MEQEIKLRKGHAKCMKDGCERTTKSGDMCCRHRQGIEIKGVPKSEYMNNYQKGYYKDNKKVTKKQLLRYIEIMQKREL